MAITGNFLRSTRGTLGARLASPNYKLDLVNESFRANARTPYFSDVVTHSRSGNATMVDSDGLLKWAPHNLALNSASPATQSITVVSGADYTVECTGVSITLSGAGTGTVTEGNPVEITASTTTLTLTVTGSEGTMWAYRSDLGGMVDNPDRGDSYVPTTSSAVYLPRRGHHVYNGSAWVNEGLLHESEARVNLVTYSEDFTDASWTKTQTTATANAVGPDGLANSAHSLVESTASGIHYIYDPIAVSSASIYSFSVFLKDAGRRYCRLSYMTNSSLNGVYADFDLQDGLIVNEGAVGLGALVNAHIEPSGNGWFRCSVSGSQSSSSFAYVVITLRDDTTNHTTEAAQVYTGDGTSGIYIWGAQIEQAPTPSSYIPTAGATVTRAAETLTIPSANLPWPTPQVIGPELVTNGTFDTDSDWTKGTGWSIADGKATSAATTYQTISQSLSNSEGIYEVRVEASGNTNSDGRLVIDLDSNLYLTGYGPDANGTFIAYLKASANATLAFGASTRATARFNGSIDNISVREINPLSVSIQMDGRMTYAYETSTLPVLFFRQVKDADTVIQAYLLTGATAADSGQFRAYQEAAGVVDFAISASNVYSPGILVPFNIASRHGSTFINGAVDGVALTANTTPTALPDLSSTDLNLGYDYMGTIKTFRIWDKDLGDTGIEEASS